MLDLVIRGGLVVRPDRLDRVDLGIADGVIQAVAAPGDDLTGHTVVDVQGRFLLPGLVDAHAHIPGYLLSNRLDDFPAATAAAALGGVTTVMLMPTDDPRTATGEYFARKRTVGEAQSLVDFAIQALIGPKSEAVEIEEMAEAGAVSFELFLAYGGNPEFIVGHDDYELLRLMRMVRDLGGIVGVTPHSASLIARLTAEQRECERARKWLDPLRYGEPPTPVERFAATRPIVSEVLGIARACTVAAEAGARIHVRALSSQRSVDMVRRFRDDVTISSEVMSHHLLFTDVDAERLGPYGIIVPPLRPDRERQSLRKALQGGDIDMVVSDHSPALREDKEKGWEDIWRSPPGMPGLQTLCQSLLALVDDGALAMTDIARVGAERPAIAFGLYPRKGALTQGSDADIVVVDDTGGTLVLDREQRSRADYTTLKGRAISSRIESVFLRGALIARDGEIVSGPIGRFVRP